MPKKTTTITTKKVVNNAKRRRVMKKWTSKGGFMISRSVPTFMLANSNALGIPNYNGPTGVGNVLLHYGLPVANTYFPNLFMIPFSLTFYPMHVQNFTDISAISDAIRFNAVRLKITYSGNSAIGGTGYLGCLPMIKYIVDNDDDVVPSFAQIDEKMGVKEYSFGANRSLVINIKPKVAPNVNGGYAIPTRATWINTGTGSIPHYGLKGYINNMDLTAVPDQISFFQFELQYNFSCKDIQ